MVEWKSSYSLTPWATTWDYSTSFVNFKIPYGRDFANPPSVDTYETQSPIDSWRYMGYLKCDDAGDFDALLKLRVNNEMKESYDDGMWGGLVILMNGGTILKKLSLQLYLSIKK
ncbi:MAG: hypothetical protein ACTSRK_19290 [Promethearchaeota archaeon]